MFSGISLGRIPAKFPVILVCLSCAIFSQQASSQSAILTDDTLLFHAVFVDPDYFRIEWRQTDDMPVEFELIESVQIKEADPAIVSVFDGNTVFIPLIILKGVSFSAEFILSSLDPVRIQLSALAPIGDSATWVDLASLLSITGEVGPAGPQGVAGPAGETGQQGITGLTGNTGATGPQGIAGPKGDTGETGPQGIDGPTGASGATGPQGIAGPKGDTGEAGPQGIAGPIGASGATGPQGIAGPQGDTGEAGPQGVAGLTGATGATGPQGIAGPKGDTGETGPQGIVGLTGATGAIGPQGIVGPKGDTGETGPQGIVGPPGIVGVYKKTGTTVFANSVANEGNSYAECDSGDNATGGGYRIGVFDQFDDSQIRVAASEPNDGATGWNVHVLWEFGSTNPEQGVTAFAVCADKTP